MADETRRLLKIFGVAVTDFEAEAEKLQAAAAQLSADSGKNQIAKLLRDATELCGELNNRWLETITLAPKKLIRTRRASEGSASDPSLARRVSMCKDAKLSCRGNTQHIFAIQNQLLSRCADAATRLLSVNDTTESEAARIEAGE